MILMGVVGLTRHSFSCSKLKKPSFSEDLSWGGYEYPFGKEYVDDPTVEVMKEIVCTRKRRPDIPTQWNTLEVRLFSFTLYYARSGPLPAGTKSGAGAAEKPK